MLNDHSITIFIKSILKSMVILAIGLALRGAIYSRIALFLTARRRQAVLAGGSVYFFFF